jgi:hypothetical protein
MALVARALTSEEEDELLGVTEFEEPGQGPARPRGGLLQKPDDEFLAALREWLRVHHVDDWTSNGETLLWYAAYASDQYRANNGAAPEHWVQLARDLIARGANPSISENWNGTTALMWACAGAAPLEMVPLLLDAGADVRAKGHNNFGHNNFSKTALAFMFTHAELSTRDTLTIVHMLLRAGATLDACCNQESAEDLLRRQQPRWPAYATDPHLIELKRVFRGVRAARGSYSRYVKKEVLVILALVRKGRSSTIHAGDHRTAFEILAKSPNEVAWHVLAFSFGMSSGPPTPRLAPPPPLPPPPPPSDSDDDDDSSVMEIDLSQ